MFCVISKKEERKCLEQEPFHKKENIYSWSERRKFKMDKENLFDDEEDIENQEEVMAALSDSDIDGMDDQLIHMNLKYESEEYR